MAKDGLEDRLRQGVLGTVKGLCPYRMAKNVKRTDLTLNDKF